MAFEVSNDTRKIWRSKDGMKMVIEDDPSINLQAFVRAAILKRPNDNIAASRSREDRKPGYDGSSDEMSGVKFINTIATTHRGSLTKHSFGDKCVPKCNLGTRNEKNGARSENPGSAQENFVDVAPDPIFTRLKGSNDRVRGGVKMFRGVAIRRRVAATHMAACQTKPQVDPGRTHL